MDGNVTLNMLAPDALAKLFDAALASPLLHRHRVKLDQLAAGERYAALPRLEARAVPHRLTTRDQGVLLIAAHLVRVRVGFG